MVAGSRTDVTRSAILAHIGAYGPTSRAGLARALEVSPALVTQVCKQLSKQGLIVEKDAEESRGGRPAQLLDLAKDAGTAFGVKIAADHLTIVEVDLAGKVSRLATEPFNTSSDVALKTLADHLQKFIDSRQGSSPVLGVGVAVPGSVDEQGVGVIYSTQIGWIDLPLGDFLRSELNLPVLVENNVNALAIAERLYGPAQRKQNTLAITIGTGIGAGVIADGLLMRGATGAAGEIGHFAVVENGPLCQCGSKGCLEALIGEEALIEKAVQAGILVKPGKIDSLRQLADQGNEIAVDIFEEAGQLLGRTVASAVNFLDPELVTISGEGVSAWTHWSFGFEKAFRSCLIPRKIGIPVRIESWQDDRWAQGAASLVLATSFDSEGIAGEQGRLVRQRLTESNAASKVS